MSGSTAATFAGGSGTDWPCVVSVVFGGGFLWVIMARMLRGGAAVDPRLTALLGGRAALAVAKVAACLTRPHAFGMALIRPGGTLAVMALLSACGGTHQLRWQDPAHLGHK